MRLFFVKIVNRKIEVLTSIPPMERNLTRVRFRAGCPSSISVVVVVVVVVVVIIFIVNPYLGSFQRPP